MNLQAAIDELTSTYQSLDVVAQGLKVDSKQVADALKKAKPDTAEYVALQALAKYNPPAPEPLPKEAPAAEE